MADIFWMFDLADSDIGFLDYVFNFAGRHYAHHGSGEAGAQADVDALDGLFAVVFLQALPLLRAASLLLALLLIGFLDIRGRLGGVFPPVFWLGIFCFGWFIYSRWEWVG